MAYRTIVAITGVEAFKKGLTDLELTQYPFAMSNAINDFSGIIKRGEQQEMARVFDRPTPYTMNALRIVYSTWKPGAKHLTGGVRFKDPSDIETGKHYIYPNVYGVKRSFKAFESMLWAKRILPPGMITVPGAGAPLDAFGNIKRGLITEILSWFEAHPVRPGFDNNSTDPTRERRRRGTRKKAGYEFFVVKKDGAGFRPGIYKRTYFALGTAISAQLIFVSHQNHGYQRTFGFYEKAREIDRQYFGVVFREQMDKALKTAFPL